MTTRAIIGILDLLKDQGWSDEAAERVAGYAEAVESDIADIREEGKRNAARYEELKTAVAGLDRKLVEMRIENEQRFAKSKEEHDKAFAELRLENERRFAEAKVESERALANFAEEVARKFAEAKLERERGFAEAKAERDAGFAEAKAEREQGFAQLRTELAEHRLENERQMAQLRADFEEAWRKVSDRIVQVGLGIAALIVGAVAAMAAAGAFG